MPEQLLHRPEVALPLVQDELPDPADILVDQSSKSMPAMMRATIAVRHVARWSLAYFFTSYRSATMPVWYAFASTRCSGTSLSRRSKNEMPSPIRIGRIE